jgi:hypothetical protein
VTSLVGSAKRWLLGMTAALLMVGVAAGTALAAPADGKTADTPMPIVVSPLPAPVSGQIAGNSGGSFEYYAYSYPGMSTMQTMTITVNTADESVANAVGVSLWLNGNEIQNFNSLGADVGTNSITFSSSDSGQILLQVWNYSETTVNYSVSVAPAVVSDSGS